MNLKKIVTSLALLVAGLSIAPAANALPPELTGMTATLIFSENFDAQPDWVIDEDGRCQAGSTCDGPWDWYYGSEKWHPDNPSYSTHHASVEINGTFPRGGTGKSMVTWDESYGSKSQWGSDAQIGKDLGGNYTDIYVEFWVRYEDDYRWEAVESDFGINSTKTSRVSSFVGDYDNDSRFSFFSGTKSSPFFISQFKTEIGKSGNGELTSVGGTARCTPSDTNYQCTDASTPIDTGKDGKLGDYVAFVDNLGDGEWHKWAYRATYNSAPGVNDGHAYVWVDDVLWYHKADLAYIGASDNSPPTGFNVLLLGGNINNIPAPESETYEQWLAFDDVVVYSLAGGAVTPPVVTTVVYAVPTTNYAIVHGGGNVLCSSRARPGTVCELTIGSIYRQTSLLVGGKTDRQYLSCIDTGCYTFYGRADALAIQD